MGRTTFAWFAIASLTGSSLLWPREGRGPQGPPAGVRGSPPAPARHDAGGPARQGPKDISGSERAAHANSQGPGTVQERLEKNPELSSRLQQVMPPGTDMSAAAGGFKNMGQFVAAAHVSHNLNIPFDQLKARMTGPDGKSLGKAIQDLRPDLDGKAAKQEAKRAEQQAKEDLEHSKAEKQN